MCRYYMKINYIYIFVVFPWFVSTKRDREGVLLSVPSGKRGKHIRSWFWNCKDWKSAEGTVRLPAYHLSGWRSSRGSGVTQSPGSLCWGALLSFCCCSAAAAPVTALCRQRGAHIPTEAAGTQEPAVSCCSGGSFCSWSWSQKRRTAEADGAPPVPLLWNGPAWAGPQSLHLPLPLLLMQKKTHTDFSFPLAFESPNSAFHWQNLTRKQLERKSVRCSLQPPSHPVIQRRFQKAGNDARWQIASPKGLKGKLSNWLENIIISLGRHIYLAHPLTVIHIYKYIVYTYFLIEASENKIRTAWSKEVWSFSNCEENFNDYDISVIILAFPEFILYIAIFADILENLERVYKFNRLLSEIFSCCLGFSVKAKNWEQEMLNSSYSKDCCEDSQN